MDCGSFWKLLCIALLCTFTISSVYVTAESIPTESECRPHIEKALNTIKADIKEPDSAEISVDIDDSKEKIDDERLVTISVDDDDDNDNDNDNNVDGNSDEEIEQNVSDENNEDENSKENESTNEVDSKENDGEEDDNGTQSNDENSEESNSGEQANEEESRNSIEDTENSTEENDAGKDDDNSTEQQNSKENDDDDDQSVEEQSADEKSIEKVTISEQGSEPTEDNDDSDEQTEQSENNDDQSEENDNKSTENNNENDNDSKEEIDSSKEDKEVEPNDDDDDDASKENDNDDDSQEEKSKEVESHEISAKSYPVDDLLLESEIPENLRDHSHIDEILGLNEDSMAQNEAIEKIADNTLKELKRIYENAIKPLEVLYKYRDLSNRHFGDPEIFSKPLVLLMGPWSGGKSSIINYLTDNEYTDFSLKTGAEPSLPYFNILMHGETEQVLDGTQLAADWTFSGLQKFGQGLQDRLRGLKLPSKLLQKVNIAEIPGILEVRKHVSRIFPFNDACQWFIDRADIIFLVYDPSKLDVGPETEAILDQLKGREYQTRIVLNKADQVHPEELLRVQSALIWNISPLMSSQQPPIMYTVSLWSHPFEENTPVRLLQAQEKALLQDLSQAIEHRIENKIASARRFAVRVRNHAKMVDCYLTTYYNHKTLFGNKKKISGEIVAHPQNYHIYEGLSTLTNISRYDLPDPDVYREFFQLNPLYEFKKLSETCTYFRGCPINKLDVAIAYDLPELVNRYKRAVSQALNTLELGNGSNDSSTDRR